ncbi:flavin reductase family protein [Streptomyces chrestomyceticus]|uniref:flavin reductase family protein n=1 Tax=Streptomyces chrestomyceticus TaxID=68185 RepID=UPI0037B7D638
MHTTARGVRPALDAGTFRDALALLAAPLTVVTTHDAEGRPRGFTASSVTSVSLDPPLVLVGIARTSSCFAAFAAAPEFVINILGAQHRDLARKFADRRADRFAGEDFAAAGSGPPRLTGAHAALRCTVTERVPAGDHDLLLGTPTEVHTTGSTRPLVWHRRRFHTL